jgi:hypothetical protein
MKIYHSRSGIERLEKTISNGTNLNGFALIVTLSLMILLTVIAVGLLTLSGISLRSSSQGEALAAARANARMALMIAIGELQKEMGPDTRISTVADQIPKSPTDGSDSGAANKRRYWTGVYDAWLAPTSPGDTDDRPKNPSFRRWLVSAENSLQSSVTTPTGAAASGDIELLGKGTLGATISATELARKSISVPAIESKTGGVTTARFAWWVGDQGVKAAVSIPLADTTVASRATVRGNLQGAPCTAIQLATAGTAKPFESLATNDPNFTKVTDWQQAGLLLGSNNKAPMPLFHDLAGYSSGLLTNVRSGGFRKDLSMYLESTAPPTSGFPDSLIAGSKGAFYQVAGEDGIRIGELWSYYNLYKELDPSSIAFTTGGSASSTSNPHLQAKASAKENQKDNFFYFKRPVIIGYKAQFSFYITPDLKAALSVDPIITFWNPYDIPVSLAPAYNSIRMEKIPYEIRDLQVKTSDGVVSKVGNFNLGGNANPSFGTGDYNYISFYCGNKSATSGAGAGVELVLKPGEVLHYSQAAGSAALAGATRKTWVAGKPGWNFGGGVYYYLKDATGNKIPTPPGAVEVSFSSVTPNDEYIIQPSVSNTTPVSVSHFETYLFDEKGSSSSTGIGGAYVDFYKGSTSQTGQARSESSGSRFTAASKPLAFPAIPGNKVTLSAGGTANDRKKWFMLYACDAKTEEDSLRPGGQFLSRLNPSAPLIDFAEMTEKELALMPFEYRVLGNEGEELFDVDKDGRGFFGGGNTSGSGVSFVTTHSIPREPLVSLASLQHSMANGFTRDSPDPSVEPVFGYSNSAVTRQSIRLPMLPQIAHAIGNSLAPSVLAMDQTTGTLTDRPLADHSFLANKALWDDWFFSGIAPRDKGPTATGQTQKDLAEKFFKGNAKLPVARYLADLGGETATVSLSRLFTVDIPKPEATTLAASYIRVDGLFNVNSTSVEAWKAMLGSLRKQPIVNRDSTGKESIDNLSDTPVVGLLTPTANPANDSKMSVTQQEQWTGRRSLSDIEIQSLAEKLVLEVRKRGPFLSLADFVNRRPGKDQNYALCGVVQAAIDAAGLNAAYKSRMAISAGGLAFAAAEKQAPAAQGAAGIVKQADILTPIAPVLSARSDSFVIRAYGEKRSADGTKVLSKAWCEAVVERDKAFVDSANPPETAISKLSATNKVFGRRFLIRTFRWLSTSEV